MNSNAVPDLAQQSGVPSPKTETEARIIDAARELFLERGFSDVSGDLLCKHAKVPKTSLYKYFGDMYGVLIAVVVREGDLFDLNLNTRPETVDEFWEELIDYGSRLMRLLNTPLCLQLDRTMHEEARRNPELAHRFYDNAYGRGHRDVTALMEHGAAQGFIQDEQTPSDLADHLISMWEGMRYIRARLGITNQPFEDPQYWSLKCV